jgi:hypothetical protein
MEIQVRNVNHAFSEIFWKMKTMGLKPEQTRNGLAYVIAEPVITTYRYPQERVLFHTGRDANPIFHLMESIWMLAGRRDVQFLQHFNSTIGQFSDDGKVFNAAYGYRWRRHFGFDQLEEVIKALRRDPETRQAVIQMWDQDDKTGCGAQNSAQALLPMPNYPRSWGNVIVACRADLRGELLQLTAVLSKTALLSFGIGHVGRDMPLIMSFAHSRLNEQVTV